MTYLKVLVLNDTRHESHAGCLLVMKQVFELVEPLAEDVMSLSVLDVLRGIDLACLDDFDLVVVNGEGTFHSDGKAGRLWMDVCSTLKKRRPNRRFVLLNTAWFNNTTLNEMLPLFDVVSFRDTVSRNNALPYVNGHVIDCPDFALLSIMKHKGFDQHRAKWGGFKQRGVSGNVPSYSDDDQFLSIFIGKNRLETFFRQLNKSDLSTPRRIFGKVSEHFFDCRPASLDEYVSVTAGARHLASGRFHGIMIAIGCNTPCSWVPSNTPKIDAATAYLAGLAEVELEELSWGKLSDEQFAAFSENCSQSLKELTNEVF